MAGLGTSFPQTVVSARGDGSRLKSITFRDGADVLHLDRVGDDLWTGKRFELRSEEWAATGEPESWTDGDVHDLLRREWAAQGSPLSGLCTIAGGGRHCQGSRIEVSAMLASCHCPACGRIFIQREGEPGVRINMWHLPAHQKAGPADLLTEECPECHAEPGYVHKLSCSRGVRKALRFSVRKAEA